MTATFHSRCLCWRCNLQGSCILPSMICKRYALSLTLYEYRRWRRESVSQFALKSCCSKYLGQEVILDMFFELLNIKTSDWYQTFISGRRLTSEWIFLQGEVLHTDAYTYFAVYRKSGVQQDKKSSAPEAQERSHQFVKLTDQFLALLVMVLTKAGLCEVRGVCLILHQSLTIGLCLYHRLLLAYWRRRGLVRVCLGKQHFSWLKYLPSQQGYYRWTLLPAFR